MSTNSGVHVRTRHAVGQDGLAATRDTHGPPGFGPSIVGASYADVRSGEQQQAPDIAPGAVDGAVHILPDSIDLDLFVQDIRPPHVVDTLPSLPDETYPIGDYAFLTTTSELYVNVADVWTLEDGSTITNGTLVAGLVRAGAIATEQLAADAVIANVANVGGTVLIDDTGITILDGAISLLDEAGDSVLSAAGFEGSWATFIRNGLYNSQFQFGTVGALTHVAYGTAAEVPYWYFTHRTNSTMTAHLVSDVLASADRYIDLRANQTIGTEISVGIASARIPMQGGQTIGCKVSWSADGATGAKPVRIRVDAFFYDRTETLISSDSTDTLDVGVDEPVGDWRWSLPDGATAPDNTVSCILRVRALWPSGSDDGMAVRVNEVMVVMDRPTYTSISLGAISINETNGILDLEDPLELNTFVGVKARPAVGGAGLFEVQLSGDSYSRIKMYADSSLPRIQMGDGSSDYDVDLYRSAANVLTLATGDQLQLANTTDVSLSSTAHAFQIGDSTGLNIRMDNNEIIAADNGAAGTLRLQADGGIIEIFENTGGAIDINASFFQLSEMTQPGAPAANGVRLFAVDSGGKTQLRVRFNTGAVQILATEP